MDTKEFNRLMSTWIEMGGTVKETKKGYMFFWKNGKPSGTRHHTQSVTSPQFFWSDLKKNSDGEFDWKKLRGNKR